MTDKPMTVGDTPPSTDLIRALLDILSHIDCEGYGGYPPTQLIRSILQYTAKYLEHNKET